MGKVVAVCIGKNKGEKKTSVKSVLLKQDWGIEGDAHAGDRTRQVSLLARESIEKMKCKIPSLSPGSFAENITTSGIELLKMRVGTKLTLGNEVKIEITQIGKECHDPCAIFRQVGHCVMPEEGVFAKVLNGGNLFPGDQIRITQ